MGDDLWDPLGKVGRELAQITQDWRQSGGEEDAENADNSEYQKNDGDRARGVVAAEPELGNAGDDGRKNDGKQSADVNDKKLFFEGPGDSEKEQDDDAEEYVAVDGAGGLFLSEGLALNRL